jgi:hypothetical protein
MAVAKQQITNEMIWNLLLQIQAEVHEILKEQRNQSGEKNTNI